MSSIVTITTDESCSMTLVLTADQLLKTDVCQNLT
jgi:hypothetical protein